MDRHTHAGAHENRDTLNSHTDIDTETQTFTNIQTYRERDIHKHIDTRTRGHTHARGLSRKQTYIKHILWIRAENK